MTDYRTNPPTSPGYRPDPYTTNPRDPQPASTGSGMGFVLFVLGGIVVMLTLVWLTLGAMDQSATTVTPAATDDVNVTIDNETAPAAGVVEDQATPAPDAPAPATAPSTTEGEATTQAPATE